MIDFPFCAQVKLQGVSRKHRDDHQLSQFWNPHWQLTLQEAYGTKQITYISSNPLWRSFKR